MGAKSLKRLPPPPPQKKKKKKKKRQVHGVTMEFVTLCIRLLWVLCPKVLSHFVYCIRLAVLEENDFLQFYPHKSLCYIYKITKH